MKYNRTVATKIVISNGQFVTAAAAVVVIDAVADVLDGCARSGCGSFPITLVLAVVTALLRQISIRFGILGMHATAIV